MVQPAMPQQLLIAQATGLINTERAFPLGAPPIPIAAGLLSIANALPQTALPGLPALGQGLLPTITGLGSFPLGQNPNILAALAPRALMPPAPRGVQPSMLVPAGRTGTG
mgnify:FL=1